MPTTQKETDQEGEQQSEQNNNLNAAVHCSLTSNEHDEQVHSRVLELECAMQSHIKLLSKPPVDWVDPVDSGFRSIR